MRGPAAACAGESHSKHSTSHSHHTTPLTSITLKTPAISGTDHDNTVNILPAVTPAWLPQHPLADSQQERKVAVWQTEKLLPIHSTTPLHQHSLAMLAAQADPPFSYGPLKSSVKPSFVLSIRHLYYSPVNHVPLPLPLHSLHSAPQTDQHSPAGQVIERAPSRPTITLLPPAAPRTLTQAGFRTAVESISQKCFTKHKNMTV